MAFFRCYFLEYKSRLCLSKECIFFVRQSLWWGTLMVFTSNHRAPFLSIQTEKQTPQPRLPQHNTWLMDNSHMSNTQYAHCLSLSVPQPPHSIHTHTHLLFSTCSETCDPASAEKLGKDHLWKFIMSWISFLAAQTFGEQSRYYFRNRSSEQWDAFSRLFHENDSAHAVFRSDGAPGPLLWTLFTT